MSQIFGILMLVIIAVWSIYRSYKLWQSGASLISIIFLAIGLQAIVLLVHKIGEYL